ncbi:MAG TPA: hypothetical protein PK208_03250 [Fibrobacteria bacterium]|nr:hypothetical protein [Fibrobacteria bacterium]
MRPNSKYSIGSLRIAAAALFALVVSSCQTEPTKPVEDGTYSVSIPPINEEYRQPDLVTWKIGSDTGAKVVEGGGSSFQIKLQSKVEGDVRFDLWRSGVRIMQLKYARTTETTLEYVSKESEDTLARAVFQQILPSKDSIAFAKKLAELVVGKDSVNRALEQAAAKVVGVNHDTLMARALQIMVESGKAIGAFVPHEDGAFLGHSLESIHLQVKVLVDLKVIVSDTNALFPPPPVRIVSNLSMPERLQAGGDAAGVNGKFEATGKIATLLAKVFQDTIDVSRHFEIPQVDLTSRPKELDLSGKLSLKARESAAAGTYRLEVVVMDADDYSVKAVTGFQVMPAADTVGPAIQILSPTTGTVLEHDVSTVAVKAQIEDPSGVDSVWIADKLAVGEGGVWSVESVEIPVTDIGFAVVVRAKDAKGNVSSKDVLVGRKAKLDPGSPTWSVLSPKANELFPFDSAATSVLWKVSDPRAEVVKAWIGGGEASKESDGIWTRRVDLPATGSLTTVTLLAVNANNDTIKGFVQVTRQADTKGPMIQIKSPVDGTVFGYDAQSVLVKVAATDPSGIDSVKIDGKPAESVGTEYAYSLALEPGKEAVIRVQAWDKLKNSAVESLTVTRKGPPDTTAPRLKLLGPASGTELSMDTKTATLRWLVTDLFGLVDADVKIDGKVAQRSADTFSLEVAAPAPGGEESHRIDVKNVKGVSNFETMTLKRAKDAVAPKLVRIDSGRTVAFETEKATVSWKVSDNYLLGSVSIAGKVVTGVNGLYSQEVALATGDNRVAIVATDSANNSSTDTVTITRAWKDTIAPVVTRQTGTGPQTVPNGTASLTVSWKVTDTLLQAVTIQGTAKTGSNGIYSTTISLAIGNNTIRLVAVDKQGNTKADEFVVVRSAPAPIHSLAEGSYIGTMMDTITAAGADSIQYSLDGKAWQKYISPLSLTRSGTFYAKSFPGGVQSSTKATIRMGTIVRGWMTTFFLSEDTLWGVGYNQSIRGDNVPSLGTGLAEHVTTPVVVATGVERVTTSRYYATTIVLKDGTIKITGKNWGQYGDGTQVASESWITIPGFTNPKQVYPGKILTQDGDLYISGQTTPFGTIYEYKKLASNVKKIGRDDVFLKNDGTVWAWGITLSQFGLGGDTSYYNIQYPYQFDSNVVDIAERGLFTWKSDGSLWARGEAYAGRVPCGTPGEISVTPCKIGHGISSVIQGFDMTFFLDKNGALIVSGKDNSYNFPWLSSSMLRLMDGVSAVSVSGCYRMPEGVIVTKQDGSLWAFGYSPKNALLFGTPDTTVSTPQRVHF